MSRPQRLVEAAATDLAGDIGDISGFVRADVLFSRERRRDGGGEAAVEDIRLVLHRLSGATVDEIDRVIFELQAMRDVVQNEGARIQREVTEYASMSRTAMASTQIIAEGLAHWRSAAAPAQHDAARHETS
jgi:hypothetical protein